MTIFSVELDSWGLISRIGRCGIHRDRIGTTNRGPPSSGRAAKARVSAGVRYNRRRRRRGGGDWVEKPAVDEHLRPDARVDDVATMFEKLAVNVLRNGSAGPGGVNGDVDRVSLG